ncbi:TLP18.3, Psb32 and MOLO-1 founding protein of phosphatase [Catalinimonas alkaloidigena]|uniref:TLP18.3, Psb32 and MOLO-1 founding protein of phosphatase n=1 Tax=Catalinimonas alkaloidigena TaxID=1075417 RepID=A0A1G9EFS9_9BACT|nr:TPM domain-containing protein [Catalinimonas alkaloidigena]SDK74911.1 TLP18.3, Psb32 and MOLO-1 founding protein of phosphatase [Catalinimonas alkaloidigena]
MAKEFFSSSQQQQIIAAIKDAELNTSGEIQVHIERTCKGEVLDRAADLFATLKMHKTALRNGVLFYLAFESHQFAILGDKGINQKVPPGFWDDIKEHMAVLFRQGKFTEGLEEGIRMAGQELKVHFPRQKDDINELPDDISFGKN